jgi:hypothetical protein
MARIEINEALNVANKSYCNIIIIMTIREHFLQALYDMSERELRAIDRYEVGKQLNLPKEETDAIVDQLIDRGRITKIAGSGKIMLGLKEKKILDSEWRRVE